MDGNLEQSASGTIEWLLNTALHFGSEFFAFIVVAGLAGAFGVYFGRDRLVALLAGLYIAIPTFQFFPWGSDMLANPLIAIAFFALIAILTMLAFSGLSSFFPTSSGGFLSLLILSVLTAGLILFIAIKIIPVESIYTFSDATKALFDSSTASFLWFIAPVVGVFFLSR